MPKPYVLYQVKDLNPEAVQASVGGKEGLVLNNRGSKCLVEFKNEAMAKKHQGNGELFTRKQVLKVLKKESWVKELPVNRGPNDAAKQKKIADEEAAKLAKEAAERVEIEELVTKLKAEAPAEEEPEVNEEGAE